MINCKYGYVSQVELKVFSDLDHDLKLKKKKRRYSIKQQPIKLSTAKKED
ncbi:hypothetical protein [Secundilactobacillus pentosiphilus]|nr:hypothetical protein [Secundilactobacillus pentosiphilus]